MKVSHVPEKPASLQKLKIILHHHLAVNCLPIPEGFAGPLVSRVASPAFFWLFLNIHDKKNTLIINFNLWQQEKNLPVQCVSDFAKTQTRMKNLRSLLTALSLILLLGGDCKRIEPTVPLVWPTFPVLDGFSLRRDLNMILIRITSWSSFRRSNGYL